MLNFRTTDLHFNLPPDWIKGGRVGGVLPFNCAAFAEGIRIKNLRSLALCAPRAAAGQRGERGRKEGVSLSLFLLLSICISSELSIPANDSRGMMVAKMMMIKTTTMTMVCGQSKQSSKLQAHAFTRASVCFPVCVILCTPHSTPVLQSGYPENILNSYS